MKTTKSDTSLWRRITKGLGILWGRLTEHGVRVSANWAFDHGVRIVTGAPVRRVSEITPQLHVGGQYRPRGWRRLTARGITAVLNLREEFDDARFDPPRYLYLPTTDDYPPSMEDLRSGVDFIAGEVAQGGGVYVHCGAGVGRAPTMAAAYLVSTGLTPAQAWERIRAVRPFVRPKPGQIAQVERFAEELEERSS